MKKVIYLLTLILAGGNAPSLSAQTIKQSAPDSSGYVAYPYTTNVPNVQEAAQPPVIQQQGVPTPSAPTPVAPTPAAPVPNAPTPSAPI
jgi:hypothetical protein